MDSACFCNWLALFGIVTSAEVAFGGIRTRVPALPALVAPMGSSPRNTHMVDSAWLGLFRVMVLLGSLVRPRCNSPKSVAHTELDYKVNEIYKRLTMFLNTLFT